MASRRAKFGGESTSIMASDEVREIRSRYAEALSYGYSVEEASRLANSGARIEPPVPAAPAPIVETRSEPAPETETATLGGLQPEPVAMEDIPPNWHELPWPQLRTLAVRLSGNAEIKSRKQAAMAIEEALAR